VAHQRARVNIPDDGNAVAFEVGLCRFGRAIIRRELRKLAYDQRLDVRTRRFLVVKICADISDVRVGETDNLAGITGVGEYFLVAGEAGIKNDFAAATGTSARRAPVKYAPVLERENRGGSVEPQVVLREWSL
jgi:hypothetical protein